MNPIREVSDLESLIKYEIEESITLEYKSAGAFSKSDGGKALLDIAKDVSAMANSDGGTLIYGMREHSTEKHKPGSIDPIDGEAFTKEWLEHAINNIRPRLDVNIVPIRLKQPAGGVVYVVEIQAGQTAHQATDLKYYRRFNFIAVPMHDYEIRDIMNRRKHPKLIVTAKLVRYRERNKLKNDGAFIVSITNDSDVLGRHFEVLVKAPPRVAGHTVMYRNATYEIGDFEHFLMSQNNATDSPLFPRNHRLAIFPFQFAQVSGPGGREADRFEVRIFVDSMPKHDQAFEAENIFEGSKINPFTGR